MRFLIVANPVAGSGAAHELSRQVKRFLSQRGHEVTAVPTDNAAMTAEAVSERADQPDTTIVGCGGDGTLHHIVQALMKHGGRARLGIVPCGRGNDLAVALGVPRDLPAALDRIVSEQTTSMDVGKVNETYFTTILSCGFDSAVAADVKKRRSLLGGNLPYATSSLRLLFSYRPVRVRLAGDFGEFDDEVLLAATGNTENYGGGLRIAPGASPHDGVLDLCVIRAVSRLTTCRLLLAAFRGGHVKHKAVAIHKTRRFTIDSREAIALHADGELVAHTPAEVQVLPSALRVAGGIPGSAGPDGGNLTPAGESQR
jgi:YegS/Rv2252/BmrU family lipid kinase